MISGVWKLSAKHFFDKPLLRQLQTDYANAMWEWGLDRGVKHSKVKHEKIKKLYGEMNEAEFQARLALSEFEKPDTQNVNRWNAINVIRGLSDLFDEYKQKLIELTRANKLLEERYEKRTKKYKRTVEALNTIIEKNHGMTAEELKKNNDLTKELSDLKKSYNAAIQNRDNEIANGIDEGIKEYKALNVKLGKENDKLRNEIDELKFKR